MSAAIEQQPLPIEDLPEEYVVVAGCITEAIDRALDSVEAPAYLSAEARDKFEALMDQVIVDFDIIWGGDE